MGQKQKTYPHISIDLETLGRKPGAPIIAIGACGFDPDTGDIDQGIEVATDFASACEAPFKVDPDTVRWWLGQSDTARENILRGTHTINQALIALTDYICDTGTYDVRVWGNGATFDISILDFAFDAVGRSAPWDFWNVRDVRTVVELAAPFMSKKDFVFEGERHCALADAQHQAKFTSAMWRVLRGADTKAPGVGA